MSEGFCPNFYSMLEKRSWKYCSDPPHLASLTRHPTLSSLLTPGKQNEFLWSKYCECLVIPRVWCRPRSTDAWYTGAGQKSAEMPVTSRPFSNTWTRQNNLLKTYVNNLNFNLYQDDESLHVLCGKTQRQLQEVGVATDGKLKVGIIFYFCTIKIKLLYLFCCTCEEIKAHRPKASDGISLSSTRLEGNADEFNVVAVDEA